MLFSHIPNNLIYWNIFFSLKLLDGFRQRNLSEIMKLQKKNVVLSLFKYMLALPRNTCSERIWHAFLTEDELEEMEWAFIFSYFHVWQLWNKRVRLSQMSKKCLVGFRKILNQYYLSPQKFHLLSEWCHTEGSYYV